MNKLISVPRLALILLVLLAVGCASSPRITTDFDPSADFSRYRTFAFHEPLAVESEGYSTPASDRMKAAARQQMEARGYVYSESAPDLWVNINAYMEQRSDVFHTQTLQHRLYYSYRAHSYVAVPYWSNRSDVYNYTEGTLNVDLVDARARRLVWEGVAVGRIARMSPADRAERIDRTMAEIFAAYPHRAR